jgi:hypothetical protein
MAKPEDLTGDNKILFKAWTSLGMSEEAAMRSLRDSGWLPMSDHERSVEFYKSLGLSEQAAEIAARGRDGSPTSGTGQSSAASTPVEESGLEWHLRMRRELADLDRKIQETKALQEEHWRREDEAKVNRERRKLGLPPVDLDRYR